MTIRPAEEDDMDQLVAMAQKFHEATPYRDAFTFDEDRVRRTMAWVFWNGVVFVAERDGALVGMIGLAVIPHLASGLETGSEIFWWVEPHARGVGLRLLRVAEGWAKEHGAAQMHLIAPDARTETLYARLDYRRLEVLFQREL